MKFQIAILLVVCLTLGCDSSRKAPTTPAPPPATSPSNSSAKAKDPNSVVEVVGYFFTGAGVCLAGIGVYTLKKILQLLLSRKVGESGEDSTNVPGGQTDTVRGTNLTHLWWVFLAGTGSGSVLMGIGVLLLR